MSKHVFLLFALVAAGGLCRGVETLTWEQNEQSDFEKGTLNQLSLRSDGRLALAPVLQEIFDSSSAYLWGAAEDSKGNLYVGGGGPGGASARLYHIDSSGKSKTLVELDALEVHAVAVDRKDQVFAATSPDGKVYRISAGGTAQEFYDPKSRYIWSMVFDSKGNLYVATGDMGEIHRVSPDGKGAVFFKTEETHARSLAVDGKDNLIVGTEPGGLILRISQAGVGFVLHQAARREVTSVAVAKDGAVYAAAVGNKTPGTVAPQPQPAPVSPAPQAGGAPMAAVAPRPVATPPPAALSAGSAGLAGGSEVYRIDPDGFPRKVWSHAQEIAYAIAFDAQGRALVGTGNKGSLYRIDSDIQSTLLLKAAPTQITGFSAGKQGKLYAVTGNIGKVYRIGPGMESQGSFESDVFDAAQFSQWGRLASRNAAHGGGLKFETRSGNLDRPHNNWSPWAPVDSAGGRIASPPARFLQYRATLTASSDGRSPEVSEVTIAYLPRNVAPVIEVIDVTPGNYRFPPQALTLTQNQNLTLQPLGNRKRPAKPATVESSVQSMQYAKGHIGARWLARDANADGMVYKVEIRGANESEWRLLKENVKEKYLSWDSTAFPDGEYRLRITASDLPDNPPAQALSSQLESDPFLVDNAAPRVSGLEAKASGGKLEVRWKAGDAHSVLTKAEYSVNGGEWHVAPPTTRLSDSREHDYSLSLDKPSSGEATIAVRVTDGWDNQAVEKVVVR